MRPRGIFTRAKVQQDVQRIVELYRRSGRISATVTPQIVELPQKRVDLIFKIDEGPKSGIAARSTSWATAAFSDNDLRDVVVTEQIALVQVLLDQRQLRPRPARVRQGAAAQVLPQPRLLRLPRRLGGGRAGARQERLRASPTRSTKAPQYQFGKVDGRDRAAEARQGRPAAAAADPHGPDSTRTRRSSRPTDALTFAAGAAGFAFVDVRPRYTPNRETGTVDVTFQVREGPRVYVDRIDIVGNTQTLDYVIRREMSVAEGDAYNRALVDRSRNQIRALGFFKDVDIEEARARRRTAPAAGAGRGAAHRRAVVQRRLFSVDQLVLDLGITQRNFRGRGQDVRARVSVGSLRQQLDFSFTEPRFLGRDLAPASTSSLPLRPAGLLGLRDRSTGGDAAPRLPADAQHPAVSSRYTLQSATRSSSDAASAIRSASGLDRALRPASARS